MNNGFKYILILAGSPKQKKKKKEKKATLCWIESLILLPWVLILKNAVH